MRIALSGDLDLARRDAFIDEVSAAVWADPSLELDLRDVRSIDSTGLSAVMQADRLARATGGHMRVLVQDGGPVRRMFELTLLHLTLDLHTA